MKTAIIAEKPSVAREIAQIIVATDAGREGELIFRYIYSHLNCQTPFERLWISSLTDKAIKEGLQNLKNGSDYDNLYYAAKARS
jgi:DNA topoisomerase-3